MRAAVSGMTRYAAVLLAKRLLTRSKRAHSTLSGRSNYFMRADKFVSQLHASLARQLYSAARPDLPHLLAGPDLLLAAPSSLVALFVAKAFERLTPDRLRARLILARLALPRHARCVIVLQPEDERGELPLRDFNAVFRPRDLPTLVQFANEREAVGNTRPTPEAIRHVARMRFSIIYKAARSIAGDEVLTYRPGPRRRDAARHDPPDISSDAAVERQGLASAKALDPDSDSLRWEDERYMYWSSMTGIAALRDDVDDTVNRSFALDFGVPYPKDLGADVILADSLPVGRFDPFQPLRGGAFAGCLIARAAEQPRVAERLERVDRRIRALVV